MDSKNVSITRFVHTYRGIEGFYFLNRRGELGYITSDGQRSAKETFPQTEDEEFLRRHPEFPELIKGFVRDMAAIPHAYLHADKAAEIEIGYILPVSDSQVWRSATLILHKKTVATLERDDKVLYSKGEKDPFQSDPEVEKVKGVRSVQQGLDDLTYHKNTFGVFRYFPALFKLPEEGVKLSGSGSEKARLRVLNLKWQDLGDQAVDATKPSDYHIVFSVLRANMIKRGAIDRDKRVQNKFTVF